MKLAGKLIIVIFKDPRSTSSLPLFIFLLTFYLSPVHAWTSSMTTPSNATVVVDLPSLDVVACLSQAHAPILALAARITFRRRSSSDPVASVVVFRVFR